MKKKAMKKILAGALAAAMVLSMAACGEESSPSGSSGATNTPAPGNAGSSTPAPAATPAPTPAPPMKLSFAVPSFRTDHAEQDNTYDKLVADLNTYLNADITWQWTLSAEHYNALGFKFAAGDVADVVVVGTDAAFFSAATGGEYETNDYNADGTPVMQEKKDAEGNVVKDKDGNPVMEAVKVKKTVTEPIFWDLTDYIKDYDNLAIIPDSAWAETSYGGRIYAIPRTRPAARFGMGYRQDWLNKLNLKEPTDWQSFKDMLYAFTYNDPDGNGEDDTVGLGVDQWYDVWDYMGAWFGVPNVWGLDANGDLIHYTQTKEYMASLDAFRELFEMGVVNDGSQKGVEAWDTLGPGKNDATLYRTNKAGAYLQVLDGARKIESYFVTQGMNGAVADTEDPEELVIMLQSYVTTESGGNQPHIRAWGGSGGGVAISKTGNVKTEEDLRKVLQILNDYNDGECLNLFEYGWENVTYELDADGYVSLWMGANDEDPTKAKLEAAGVSSTNYRDGFNQIASYFTAEENARPVTTPPLKAAINVLEEELKNGRENKQYLVMNMGAGYSSEYYVLNGVALDKIINDAEMQYISGKIDKTAMEAAIKQWWTSGGETVTAEMNKQYHGN